MRFSSTFRQLYISLLEEVVRQNEFFKSLTNSLRTLHHSTKIERKMENGNETCALLPRLNMLINVYSRKPSSDHSRKRKNDNQSNTVINV